MTRCILSVVFRDVEAGIVRWGRCMREGCRLHDVVLPPVPIGMEIETRCTGYLADSNQNGDTTSQAHPLQRQRKSGSGVGTELKIMLNQLALVPRSGCECDAMADEMDALGVVGCRRERPRLVAHLEKAYAKLGLSRRQEIELWLKAIPVWIVVNPLDPAGSLLDEAIRRAESKATA